MSDKEISSLIHEIYQDSLSEDEELISEIIKIESTSKVRETSTRNRKDMIFKLLEEAIEKNNE